MTEVHYSWEYPADDLEEDYVEGSLLLTPHIVSFADPRLDNYATDGAMVVGLLAALTQEGFQCYRWSEHPKDLLYTLTEDGIVIPAYSFPAFRMTTEETFHEIAQYNSDYSRFSKLVYAEPFDANDLAHQVLYAEFLAGE